MKLRLLESVVPISRKAVNASKALEIKFYFPATKELVVNDVVVVIVVVTLR